MTYGNFQHYCAGYGFIFTPLNVSQFGKAWRQLGDIDLVYGVACDVACGTNYQESLTLAVKHHLDSLEESDQ